MLDRRCDRSGGWYACWPWDKPHPKGYGQIWYEGRQRWAHQAVYMATYGPIPEGLVIRHRCDNNRCINPNHLELGTVRDNNLDRLRRGRLDHILKPAQVVEIRRRYAAGGVRQRDLAEEFGVQRPAISRIVNGYRHQYPESQPPKAVAS